MTGIHWRRSKVWWGRADGEVDLLRDSPPNVFVRDAEGLSESYIAVAENLIPWRRI